MIEEVGQMMEDFDDLGYVVEEELATVLLLMTKLQKPLLLEGPPGVGKTEASKIIASYQDTDLIRLQCYEGLDVNSAVYEWNYQRQLLSIKISENKNTPASEVEDQIFGEDFLLKRPLLKAITASKSPVLLIDEIDRADEEFEAFLLELLSDFQISIPEMGTVQAVHRPIVILTSNRTRELSDALKRRCLYHWVDFPSFAKEYAILKKKNPEVDEELLRAIVSFVAQLRHQKLQKIPGIAETLDWANALATLQVQSLSSEVIERTLGCILKSNGDIDMVKGSLDSLLSEIAS
ncbi:MAG: MoxR family ATPase [Bacteroidota bacterium]